MKLRRARLFAVVLILTTAASLVNVESAGATEIVAATCQPVSPLGFYTAVAQQQSLAQPFTAATGGRLENMNLSLSRSDGVTEPIAVALTTFDDTTGQPGNTLAGPVMLPAAQFQNVLVPSLTTVTFPQQVSLKVGERAAIVLSSSADLFAMDFYRFHVTATPCADEDLRGKGPATGPAYVPTGSSGSFIVTVAACDRPGRGHGDKNHVHCDASGHT